MDNSHSDITGPFQMTSGREDLLAKVIEFFPYPIQVYSPEGTSVMMNRAMIREYHIPGPELVVGKYNIFEDPSIIALGGIDQLKRAFRGETVFFHDIKVPLEDISKRYSITDFDVEAIYQDITVFPIPNEAGEVGCVVALMMNRRIYRGRDEIERAKEYLETHWLEPYKADEAAKAACLSKSHFNRLFKKHTGQTPHGYYVNYRIGRVKEKLLDPNLSVSEAFSACNMNYNGYSARLFQEKVGVSPSRYRRISR